jgi:hypothetical protein
MTKIFMIKDNHGFISIEIGSRFEFNSRIAYPIFLLKSNGQINCVLEYEKYLSKSVFF